MANMAPADMMTAQPRRRRSRSRMSLPVRLSLLALFAALLPVAAVVGINTYLARGALIDQGRQAISTDANAKTALIDAYLSERLADGFTLAQVPTVAPYVVCTTAGDQAPAALGCDKPTQLALYKDSMTRTLGAGPVRDKNYGAWTLFDAQGHFLTSSDTKATSQTVAPSPATDIEQVVRQNKQRVSNVYYSPQDQHAFIYTYTPVVLTNPATQAKTVVGFMRATLRIDYLWNIVGKESGANGTDSYAFITDNDGIRIASSKQDELFTSVKPLSAATQTEISTDKRFGSDTPIQQLDLPAVADALDAGQTEQSFQSVASPDGKTEFQFVRIKLATVPWSYFVLSPISTVTQVATDQVKNSLIIAGVIAVLAILIGLLIGSRLSRPVQASVEDLEGAALQLHSLAARQEQSAGEQHWVVDACSTGLESVRYLSDAMHQAARRIIDASNWFGDYWNRLTEEQARRTVQHLQELAHYIDEAARRQQLSSERLGKAITVTRQVSDQLVAGAGAANQSAEQLEQVVHGLHRVVGGKARQMSYGDSLDGGALDDGQLMLPAGQYGMDSGYMDPGYMNGAQYGQPAYGQQGYSQQGYSQPQPSGATSRGDQGRPRIPNPPSMWGDYISPPSNYGAGNGRSNMPSQWGSQMPDGRSGW
ncbi:MAG TPA: hypothetical protein VH349_17050 [Ktedonobacterales bacterium]